jgi:hypothetical protein
MVSKAIICNNPAADNINIPAETQALRLTAILIKNVDGFFDKKYPTIFTTVKQVL